MEKYDRVVCVTIDDEFPGMEWWDNWGGPRLLEKFGFSDDDCFARRYVTPEQAKELREQASEIQGYFDGCEFAPEALLFREEQLPEGSYVWHSSIVADKDPLIHEGWYFDLSLGEGKTLHSDCYLTFHKAVEALFDYLEDCCRIKCVVFRPSGCETICK